MKANPLTLAALATSAVPGLTVSGFGTNNSDTSDERDAVLDTNHGLVSIRLPLNDSAAVRHSAELLALTSLTESVRSTLSFEIPNVLGVIGYKGTRAVVATRMIGDPLSAFGSDAVDQWGKEIVDVLVGIQEIPLSALRDSGHQVMSTDHIRAQALKTLNRAAETGLLPENIHERWKHILFEDSFWDFRPTTIHGDLDEDKIIVNPDGSYGIIGWNALQVADPAMDFSWISPYPNSEELFDHYAKQVTASDITSFVLRAQFWSEFSLAKYLLHGVESRDEAVTEDAINMLNELTEFVSVTGSSDLKPKILSKNIEQILDSTPDLIQNQSDTAAFESLDEDRSFVIDEDFIDDEENNATSIDETTDLSSIDDQTSDTPSDTSER